MHTYLSACQRSPDMQIKQAGARRFTGETKFHIGICQGLVKAKTRPEKVKHRADSLLSGWGDHRCAWVAWVPVESHCSDVTTYNCSANYLVAGLPHDKGGVTD
jgi:hypothetical protein